jgi:hypothetical protein
MDDSQWCGIELEPTRVELTTCREEEAHEKSKEAAVVDGLGRF